MATTFVAQPMAPAGAAERPSPGQSAGSPAAHEMVLVLKARCPLAATLRPAGHACPAQLPVLGQLKTAGATVVATTSLVDTITAMLTPSEVHTFSTSPDVSQVVPDSTVGSPVAFAAGAASSPAPARAHGPGAVASPELRAEQLAPRTELCGTRSAPEVDPQALQDINATPALAMGFDGAGVTVATLADGLNPANGDLVRNAAYGKAGTRVVAHYQDFSGDGTATKTEGAEAFGDASSIVAQGNTAYNLSTYVNPALAAVLPKAGCWIKIVGAAPGASLLALKVTGQKNQGTVSGIVQAVQYAVQHKALVINESFGSNNFPDTSVDVVRQADDAAVAAGVTVVVSSGDAGTTNTIGSPASDPDVIDVGASTTFRSYAQTDLGGFYNPAVGNGSWVNNNISSLSSAGFTEAGGTVDLVAPGDSNWALCSTNFKTYTGCADILGGEDNGLQNFGGTSEAAPLTAAAAADVIQAYAQAHGGTDPSPALVKQILCSTATDIHAPAAEQGAGLLNVLGAVKLAESLPAGDAGSAPSPNLAAKGLAGAPSGSILVSPNQVNVIAAPGSSTAKQISLTNTGARPATLDLSTRALTDKVYDTGPRSFVLDPDNPTTNTGTFPIWSGVTEVYQTETFKVPAASGARLVFSAAYKNTDETSDLHFALFEPDGSYAAYSEPQGLGDYGQVEVDAPSPGTWTALFFTVQNGASKGAIGTSGTVQWDATTWRYGPAGTISPSSMTIPPGQTATATVSLAVPGAAGNSDQSVVITSAVWQTTLPVTVTAMIPMSSNGSKFSGVLTGGNGRQGAQAQANTYFFQVPAGKADLDASVALHNDPSEALVGYLVDPNGQTVGYSSNYTLVSSGSSFAPLATAQLVPGVTPYLQIYHVAPAAGLWELVLEWENPVTGNELTEPFNGAIQFDQVRLSAKDLPNAPSATLVQDETTSFRVDLDNTGVAPEAFFVDPRLEKTTRITLKNQNPAVKASHFTVPLTTGIKFPLYIVPPGTTQLNASVNRLSGSDPVSFDMSYISGDPDISPGGTTPGVTGSDAPASEDLTLAQPDIGPGVWALNPGEVGPYPGGGAPKDTISVSVSAVTQAFDKTVKSDTNDFWQDGFNFDKFHYLEPDQSVAIDVDITPTSAPGTHVSGTLYIDDFMLASFVSLGAVWPDADELAAIPYSYTVVSP